MRVTRDSAAWRFIVSFRVMSRGQPNLSTQILQLQAQTWAPKAAMPQATHANACHYHRLVVCVTKRVHIFAILTYHRRFIACKLHHMNPW